jgi:hypothetical protein
MQQALERLQLMFEKHGDTRFDWLRAYSDNDPPDSDLHKPGGKRDPADGLALTSNTARPLTQNRLGWTAVAKIPCTTKTERRWYISAQTWKEEICKGFDLKALNSELVKRGALEMEEEKDGRTRPPKVVINEQRGRYYTVTPRIFSVASDPCEDDLDA